MGNKKNRSGPSKYQIKRQKSLAASHLVNNSAILALEARSSSETVHGTVHPISNSNLSPPMVSSPQSPCSTQHISSSSSHGSEPQHHDDSPSIKHVFVADWLEDEDAYPDDEALETNSVEEEYAGGFKFFISPVNATPLFPVASASVALPPTVLSPASPQTVDSKINHSIIALIPKSANTSSASDFCPISCCNVIYKVIAKLLAARLSQALAPIISPMQNAFLGGRLMTDNIHLLQELLRNYGRKRTSPRCMMKIDFKKAFDSVQWPFLRQLLLLLGFPSRAENQCQQIFHLFGGVSGSIKHSILENTGFAEGSFPFRYLGVPLSPHRLLASQFSPLLHKLESAINGWLGRNLSYAGRAELLKANLLLLNGILFVSPSLKEGWVSLISKLATIVSLPSSSGISTSSLTLFGSNGFINIICNLPPFGTSQLIPPHPLFGNQPSFFATAYLIFVVASLSLYL
uniref:Reverse transcriptase domain-containing protein n=1 Tax=Populus alba TaxID=43335 RepID=A0A4V6XW25_POPAL|nr:hypothetical protein D5086_0000285070 [Populus alba]